jgi:hypothetical protein
MYKIVYYFYDCVYGMSKFQSITLYPITRYKNHSESGNLGTEFAGITWTFVQRIMYDQDQTN